MTTYALGYGASCLLLLGGALCAQGVHAQQADGARDLVVAAAFEVSGTAVLRDIEIEGAFPQAFRLSEPHEPPPYDAVIEVSELGSKEAGPNFGLGYFVAVPRDHPEVLVPIRGGLTQHDCSDAACSDQIQVCSAEPQVCTHATLRCNRVGKDCTYTSIDGDPALLRRSLNLFEGRATDVALLFVLDDAAAGSVVSQMYANGAPLEQGYHLVERRGSREAQDAQRTRCEVESHANVLKHYSAELGVTLTSEAALLDHLALKQFNERHGTGHVLRDVTGASRIDEEELQELYIRISAAFADRVMRDMIARKCLVGTTGYEVVGRLDSRTLTMPLVDAALPKQGDGFLVGSPWRVGHTPFDW